MQFFHERTGAAIGPPCPEGSLAVHREVIDAFVFEDPIIDPIVKDVMIGGFVPFSHLFANFDVFFVDVELDDPLQNGRFSKRSQPYRAHHHRIEVPHPHVHEDVEAYQPPSDSKL